MSGPWLLVEQVVWGPACAILPERYRNRIAREHGIDATRWSLLLGLVEGTIGLVLYMVGYLMFIGAYGAHHQWLLLQNWTSDLDSGDLMFSGIFGFIAWHMLPHAWVFSYLALTGLVRVVQFLAVREPIGEPIVILAMLVFGGAKHRTKERKRQRELGEEVPDRYYESPPGEDCDLLLVSCRDKPAWNERVTIEVADRFYSLVRREERRDGDKRVVCFLLREKEDAAVIRGFVSWDQDPLNPRNFTPPAERG